MNYPEVIRDQIEKFELHHNVVSIDFEFPPATMEPTIIGLCAGGVPVSSHYGDAEAQMLANLEDQKVTWLGHNSLTVEREIIEKETGSLPPLERMEDSMLRHYLCNAELCKGTAKDEDEEDPRGIGFMDLWSMSSLYTELPQWKQCRGTRCDGPCRYHDELGYNGLDALAPDIALPRLKADMCSKHIPESLYEHLKKVMVSCEQMSKKGVKIDRELVATLEAEFINKKGGIFPSRIQNKIGKKGQPLKALEEVWEAPFNPRSPKQVVEWFQLQGVYLGSTEKDEVQKILGRLPDSTDSQVKDLLGKLYDYKDAGKGLKAWTDERYVGHDGLMHPRFNATGTSLGRLASSNPNFQNVPRVRWGQGVRRAVVPRDKGLILVKADKSQLELRVCAWYAGMDIPHTVDAFNWLVEHSDGAFAEAERIAKKGFTERDHAKSVSHGANYGEGIKLLTGKDLMSDRTKRMIDVGALVVHKDWEYHGGVIGFTGINLAERLFGSASWDNRAKANAIQEGYFKRFDAIRKWQMKVTEQVEKGFVQSSSGRYLTLLGTPEDKLKIAFAFFGQGGGADDVQEGMVRYYEMGETPILQVHDELVFEFPESVTDSTLLEFFSVMSAPSKLMPGFSCPVKIGRGPNWLDMKEVGKV